MLLNFGQIPETVIPNMRGGEGQVAAHMFTDSCNKIMKGLLAPGCTIGLHTHDTSSEIIYIPASTSPCPPGRSTTAPRATSTASSTTATLT